MPCHQGCSRLEKYGFKRRLEISDHNSEMDRSSSIEEVKNSWRSQRRSRIPFLAVATKNRHWPKTAHDCLEKPRESSSTTCSTTAWPPGQASTHVSNPGVRAIARDAGTRIDLKQFFSEVAASGWVGTAWLARIGCRDVWPGGRSQFPTCGSLIC